MQNVEEDGVRMVGTLWHEVVWWAEILKAKKMRNRWIFVTFGVLLPKKAADVRKIGSRDFHQAIQRAIEV